jgi:hypothetical protein
VLDPFLAAVFHRLGHKLGRDDHVHHIDVVRAVQDRLVGLDAADLVRAGIDGVYGPREAEIDQVLDHPVADGKILGGGTDDGHRSGPE